MELHFKKTFTKSYLKLSAQERGKVDEAIADFQEAPIKITFAIML